MDHGADVQQFCKVCLAAMLDIDAADIQPSTTFASLGLDSATAVHFVLEVEQETGLEFYPAVTHDYPTLAEFAGYVSQRMR